MRQMELSSNEHTSARSIEITLVLNTVNANTDATTTNAIRIIAVFQSGNTMLAGVHIALVLFETYGRAKQPDRSEKDSRRQFRITARLDLLENVALRPSRRLFVGVGSELGESPAIEQARSKHCKSRGEYQFRR